MLLSLLSFLKLLPFAKIPFSSGLLVEVIFIFQDPFGISPPLGNLPQFTPSIFFSQPWVSIRYEYIYHRADCICIVFYLLYNYLSINQSRGWSVGKTQLTDCFVNDVLWEHNHVHLITHCLRLLPTITTELSSGDRDGWSPKSRIFAVCFFKLCQPLNQNVCYIL